MSLKKFCAYAGCKEVVGISERYCVKHQKEYDANNHDRIKRYDKYRGSPSARGYDDDWERLRLQYLHDHPLCEDCEEQDVTEIATEVHHKVKVKKDRSRRLDYSNLRSLCHSCHSKRTARGE